MDGVAKLMALKIIIIMAEIRQMPSLPISGTCIQTDTDFLGGYLTFAGAHRDRNNGETCTDDKLVLNIKNAITEPGPLECLHVYAGRNHSESKIIMYA